MRVDEHLLTVSVAATSAASDNHLLVTMTDGKTWFGAPPDAAVMQFELNELWYELPFELRPLRIFDIAVHEAAHVNVQAPVWNGQAGDHAWPAWTARPSELPSAEALRRSAPSRKRKPSSN